MGLPCSLAGLGLSVSTGRVVDFRARAFLRAQPEPGTVPLLYPAHLERGRVIWPRSRSPKPNSLALGQETESLLVPNEHYVLVRRFSAKEERRRLVATVFQAGSVPGAHVGFENHLNYFHRRGRGLEIGVARGLAAFLNSTPADQHFRQFSGHTQVNATDLRNFRYPGLAQLSALGTTIGDRVLEQEALDDLLDQGINAPAR
jgi:adenine-specific DNA-methyltransferase